MLPHDPRAEHASAGGRAFQVLAPDGVALDAREHSPNTRLLAAAILVHGINTDLDEGGMYARLAGRLAAAGLGVVRFSFRGHGRSGGSPRGATIAGEMLDVEAVAAAARARWPDVPLAVVAASMGAVPVIETAPFVRPDLLVLWNPVLDLRRTFVEPELPWGHANFSAAAWTAADRVGFLLLDSEFEMGRVLLAELRRHQPLRSLAELPKGPTLIVHAENDSYVSFAIALATAERLGHDFHAVKGSDHGFDTTDREDEAIDITVKWIGDRTESRGTRGDGVREWAPGDPPVG